MAMQSHVDPCLFIVYMHISGDLVSDELAAALAGFEPTQGGSPRALLDALPSRSRQIQFHEAYHFWQGLRLPFMYRYATIAFRQAVLAFGKAAASGTVPRDWDVLLPEFERLGLDERIARVDPGHLVWGRIAARFPDDAFDEVRIAPLDLLECAASLAEYQVSVRGDRTDPVVLARWAKRNPAALGIYDFVARYLGDGRIALRALLPLINVSFHTSEPVKTFASLLHRVRATFLGSGEFGRQFLAHPEPCRWRELFLLWLDDLDYEAAPDSDARILGSPYQRLTLAQWVGGHLGSEKTGSLIHPFLGPLARRWIALEAERPEHHLIFDQPGWVWPHDFDRWLEDFTPPFSVYRFHLGAGGDRVVFVGRADVREFTSPPMVSGAAWRDFLADTLTIYGAVRRASGAHFDEEQRTCHHRGCPHYAANLCNTYPVIPKEFADCGFPVRLDRLVATFTRRKQHGNARDRRRPAH